MLSLIPISSLGFWYIKDDNMFLYASFLVKSLIVAISIIIDVSLCCPSITSYNPEPSSLYSLEHKTILPMKYGSYSSKTLLFSLFSPIESIISSINCFKLSLFHEYAL